MNKFLGVALAIFLQTVHMAQGAGSGDDKEKDGFKNVVGSLERAGATSVTEVVPVLSSAAVPGDASAAHAITPTARSEPAVDARTLDILSRVTDADLLNAPVFNGTGEDFANRLEQAVAGFNRESAASHAAATRGGSGAAVAKVFPTGDGFGSRLRDAFSSPASTALSDPRTATAAADASSTGAKLSTQQTLEAMYAHIVRNPAHVTALDEKGKTPIILALENALPGIASAVDRNCAKFSSAVRDVMSTLGHAAVKDGNADYVYKTIKMYLENGAVATMDAEDVDGGTALTAALSQGFPKVAELLLAHGANPLVGTAGGLSTLALATENGSGEVANAILTAIRMRNLPLPIEPDKIFKNPDGGDTTLVHVIARGAGEVKQEELKDNIISLLATAGGLRALQMKDESGKWPEEIVNPSVKYKDGVTLKEHMQSLREGYASFIEQLTTDISQDASVLRKLVPMAKYITEQPRKNFPPREWDKAQRILRDIVPAEEKEKADAAIREAAAELERKEAEASRQILLLQENVDKLPGFIGQLKTAKGKGLEAINRQIGEILAELTETYPAIKASTKDIPYIRRDLEKVMKAIRHHKNSIVIVNAVINQLMPEDAAAEKAADAAAAKAAADAERTKAAAAAIAIVAERRCDLAAADLDVPTLEIFVKASKSQQPSIKVALEEKIAAAKAAAASRGEAPSIDDEDLRHFRRQIVHLFEFNPGAIDPRVKSIVTMASRSASNMFIWSVLKFSQDPMLSKAYDAITKVAIAKKAVYEPGSVHRSLITPGGHAPRGGDLSQRDGASTIDGGTVWESGTVLGPDRRAETEFVPDETGDEAPAAAAVARFTFPSIITDDDIKTLLYLYKGEYEKIDGNRITIWKLFNNLGDGFEARFENNAKQTGKLKIVDTKKAKELSDAGEDTSDASTSTHTKHTRAFKGVQKAFGAGCVALLGARGIELEDIRTLDTGRTLAARAAGAGMGSAAAAAAPAKGGSGSPSSDEAEYDALVERATEAHRRMTETVQDINIQLGFGEDPKGITDLMRHLNTGSPTAAGLSRDAIARIDALNACGRAVQTARAALDKYTRERADASGDAGAGALKRSNGKSAGKSRSAAAGAGSAE